MQTPNHRRPEATQDHDCPRQRVPGHADTDHDLSVGVLLPHERRCNVDRAHVCEGRVRCVGQSDAEITKDFDVTQTSDSLTDWKMFVQVYLVSDTRRPRRA